MPLVGAPHYTAPLAMLRLPHIHLACLCRGAAPRGSRITPVCRGDDGPSTPRRRSRDNETGGQHCSHCLRATPQLIPAKSISLLPEQKVVTTSVAGARARWCAELGGAGSRVGWKQGRSRCVGAGTASHSGVRWRREVLPPASIRRRSYHFLSLRPRFFAPRGNHRDEVLGA